MMQIKFNFIFCGLSFTACQRHTPSIVAGGCDWPLLPAVGLSNNDVIALRALRQFPQLRYVSYIPYIYLRCVGGNHAQDVKLFKHHVRVTDHIFPNLVLN